MTPLMKQYFEIKEQCPDALLLFQVGDFYELFFEDAQKAASFLGITLTKRGTHQGEPIPLCGVPVHALDHYLVKLVRGGFKVALCDQLEQAVPGVVVKRGITQLLTPGTLTDTRLLNEKSASYLMSFFPHENGWGVLFGELMTAQLCATVVPYDGYRVLEAELARFLPDEIVVPHTPQGKQFERYFRQLGYFVTLNHQDESSEQADMMRAWIARQFGKEVAAQVNTREALAHALMGFYQYLKKHHAGALAQFNQLRLYEPDDFLIIDAATQRNLELVANTRDGGRAHTLVELMDRAVTPMGSRMIKKWVTRPLVDGAAIAQRQDAVGYLVECHTVCAGLEKNLAIMSDIERVIGRIALKRALVHDYCVLMRALDVLPALKALLSHAEQGALLTTLSGALYEFGPLKDLLEASLNDDASTDWMIKKGFDLELDHVRDLVDNTQAHIVQLERKEQAATGIGSLKIVYNQVHGYSIEITKTHMSRVPEHYVRQQTLAGRERFIIPELRDLQYTIETARREIQEIERAVFARVCNEVAVHVPALRRTAQAVAHIDALVSLARLAYGNDYVRPVFNENREIIIEAGRHPVVERSRDTLFIPNDTRLTDQESLWIITGPNMGGKSTYLRQVALICIMAHCGSFVPARAAQVPQLDRIFTRIGAGDSLAEGKSTFLVEMEETALICQYATQHSLIILDEVGRGTSTHDGLAIAHAVVEFVHTVVGARVLFATHYHELTALHEQYPGIAAYHTASRRTAQGIVFLHTIVKGVADGSFGIDVACLAGLPPSVIKRAQELVSTMHYNSSHS